MTGNRKIRRCVRLSGYNNTYQYDEENLIILNRHYLQKITQNETRIYSVKENVLPDNIYNLYNYFPYKDFAFYHDNNEFIKFINPTGNLFEENKIDKLLINIYKDYKSLLRNEDGLKDKIDNFLQENKLLLLNDRLFIANINKAKEYYKFIKENKKVEDKKTENKMSFDLWPGAILLVGFDKDNNVYWSGKKDNKDVIAVLNMYGELLDCFLFKKRFDPVVAPNGDIYGWDKKPDGITFYKIPNNW